MRRWLVLALVLGGATARAEPPATEQAAALYDEGKRHFDIGEYAAAIASWKQSYLLSSAPLLLFNIGQAYRLSGDCAQANRFYLRYKYAAPDGTPGVELEPAMAKCAGVDPAVGDDTPPPPPPVVPQPPPPPQQSPQPQPPPPVHMMLRDDGHGLRTAGVVTGAAGLALGALAAVAAIEAAGDAHDVESQARGTPWSSALADEQSHGEAWRTGAWVLGGAGVAAAITGAFVYWRGTRAVTQLEVAAAPGRAQIGWSCAF